MQIIDPHMLLPDKDVLQDVIHGHPLRSNLADYVDTVEIFLSERCEIPQECIESEADHKVRLGLGRLSKNKPNFRYILYHEFTHVGDRSRPEFKYSEELKASLSDSERMAVMELWNLSIDARLNVVGLFDLGKPEVCYSKKHGWLPGTDQGKLQGHAVVLENHRRVPVVLIEQLHQVMLDLHVVMRAREAEPRGCLQGGTRLVIQFSDKSF